MVKPQQPELRQSDRGATSDDATKERLSVPHAPSVGGDTGPVPADNQPGHRPPHDQDKPSGEAFVDKTHALAEEARRQSSPRTPAARSAIRVIRIAGTSFDIAGTS